MKYEYTVKHNGVIYKPGEDVPQEGASNPVIVDKPTNKPAEEVAKPVRKTKASKQETL